MKKSVISLMTAAILPFALTTSLTNTIAIVKDDNTAAFDLSFHIDETFSKRHEKSEVDESLFDKFLKYSLLVTDKISLSAEEIELCHKIFVTERTYMPYITCPYARETIKSGIAPPRISTDNKKILVSMADPTVARTVECYAYYPDIEYKCFDYNYSDKWEYWLDNSGTERLICDYALNNGPAYEKSYSEKPDWYEHDELVELCWCGLDLIENDDSYMYAGKINGRRFKDSLYTQTITSGIWVYQLLEDGSAFIVDCTLPKYSQAEPIEEPLVLPTEIDGHVVSGIQYALSGTGVSKLVIPDNYKNVFFLSGMNYLTEVDVNAPELTLKSFLLDCPNLESAILNVKSIENNVFFDCDNLKSLEIKSAEGISYNAFSDLPSLTEVTLPENLRYIGQDAFTNTSVTELIIPKSVEIVGALKNPYIYKGELIDPLTADCIRIADDDCVIKSYYDSEAHRYAIANGCRFSPLDVMQYGDVNADGAFSISDVVVFQKWLLAVPDTQLTDWKAADFCADGRLDVFDLCLMKIQLIEKINVDNPNVDVYSTLHSVTDIYDVHEAWNGYIARSENELNDIIAKNESVSSRDITIDGIDKDFFNDKSIVVIYSQSSAGNRYSIIDDMTIKDNTINISTITKSPMIATPNILYRRYIYCIDKNSVANVNDISFNDTSSSYQYEERNDVAKWYKEWCQS